MEKKIRFPDGIEFDVIDIHGFRTEIRGATRDVIKIEMNAKYEDVNRLFIDGASYSIIDIEYTEDEIYRLDDGGNLIEVIIDKEGNTVELSESTSNLNKSQSHKTERVYNYSEYSLAGEIIDYRDGRCSVFMGKPTEIELLKAYNEIYKQILSAIDIHPDLMNSICVSIDTTNSITAQVLNDMLS